MLRTPVPHLPRGFRGLFDVDNRLRRRAIWPLLASLPSTARFVLDAGCGDGAWALDLAVAHPDWRLVGLDWNAASIERATAAARSRGLGNVTFDCGDFLTYRPAAPCDVVLSIASAHYLVEAGSGDVLFRQFASWLAPTGCLVLYGPRRRDEVPRLSRLPDPFVLRDVFSADQLSCLCEAVGLDVERLLAVTGRAGTIAKQVRRLAGESVVRRVVALPVQVALEQVDQLVSNTDVSAASAGLLLVARSRRTGQL